MTPKTSSDAPDASDLLSSIRERITSLRNQRGWNKETLSQRAGMRPQRLSNLERGVHKLRLDDLLRLAEAFGVSLDELAYGAPSRRGRLALLAGRIEALAPAGEELAACATVLELLLAALAMRSSARPAPGDTHPAARLQP
jgi:transcriptional regulator with XRE-family HTH domain